MILESDMEKAIIDLLKQDSTLAPMTMSNTVFAMNPVAYPVNNAYKGAILVTVSYENFQQAILGTAQVNREWRVIVAVGVRDLRSNDDLWNTKALVNSALAFQKPLNEFGKLYPVNSQPFAEQTEGIFWLRMEFSISNYIGVS